jgi:hypothetical protein
MNLPQRIVLIFAFLVILAMTLFPPWKRIYNYPAEYGDYMNPHMEQSAGYHLIIRDQSSGSAYAILHIDTTRLGVQFIGVLISTCLLFVILRSSQKEQRR